jgi:hypothetical protein
MRKSDACPTKYFRAADLPADWELTVEIEMARLEKFEGDRSKGDNEKLVVYFRRQNPASLSVPYCGTKSSKPRMRKIPTIGRDITSSCTAL